MDKKALSERDITTRFVLKAVREAGWSEDQIFEEVSITADRVSGRGRQGPHRVPKTAKRADIVLFHKPGIPIAVIEVKDNNHGVGAGMKQALEYADRLGLSLAYSTNGDAFIENDRSGASKKIEREVPLDGFPTPAELWRRYCVQRNITPSEEAVVAQDWYLGMVDKPARSYQIKAVNLTMEAIAKGQSRILLVMATGTGKTYTAFQIIWRLWKAKTKKRILFLADRNILVDQAKNNDFQPFGQALTKIDNRNADKSYEIYLALYQAVAGADEAKNIYKQFSPGFFDLVIIDECHRGSAAENSAWREILEYFSAATQIGLTATPKETEDVSNIDYFGAPVFTYSLREGIEDGYLAPYTVIRIDTDKDLEGYRPEKGTRDKYQKLVPDRKYKRRDLDRTLVLDERTQLVARKVTEYLKESGDRYAKTIVFCQDIEHAERMRSALVNENADLVQENRRYVCSITGDDATELSDFILPSARYPVIATTSKLLTTGVDAQTVKLIVIDQEIGSMTEFKQIIGRGTRIREDYGKLAFTIMDFRGATRHFEDKKFDGPPERVYEPKKGDPVVPPPDGVDADGEDSAPLSPTSAMITRERSREKYHLADVNVVVARETVERYGADGKRIEAGVEEHARAVLRKMFPTRAELRACWLVPATRGELLGDLEKEGVSVVDLGTRHNDEHATFDLLAHAGYAAPLVPRRVRARSAAVQKVLTGYKGLPRKVLEGLLDRFEAGHETLDNGDDLRLPPFNAIGTSVELMRSFGGRAKFEAAIAALEEALYGDDA
jgi:type I restriction enzyme R subunit